MLRPAATVRTATSWPPLPSTRPETHGATGDGTDCRGHR
jgi:hypothetical protein